MGIVEDPFGSEKPKLPQGKPAGFMVQRSLRGGDNQKLFSLLVNLKREGNLMRILCSMSIGLLIGFVGAEVASAQRPGGGGGGGCNRSPSSGSRYTNSQSPLASQYSPQSYMQPSYQQQAYMQRAYIQQAYMQQQLAYAQAAAEIERQSQAREAERLANVRKAAEARRSVEEKKREKRAEKLASTKAAKTVE